MKGAGMLVVSLRSVNFGICSGQNAIGEYDELEICDNAFKKLLMGIR